MSTHRALRGGGTVDDTAFCQPDSYINGTASVGARSYLGHGVYVNAGVTIGTDCIICDRVRVIANVPNGTTIACDCCAGGGGGGGTVVPVISVDSVHTVGVKLDAIVTTGMVKGTLAYVGNDSFVGQGSVHRYYTLVYSENNPTSGTDLEVVNSPTFGADGAQWLSLDTVNQQALSKGFWSIDEAAGQDENDGWGATEAAADAHPLKTMAELNRRIFGANYAGTVVFHQLSTITTLTTLTNAKTRDGNGFIIWKGKKTVIFTGNIGVFTAANPAGAAGTQITIPGLPVSFTASGLVGFMIESTNEARLAWIQKDMGAKTARITVPSDVDVTTFNTGTVQVFANGEAIRVVTVPNLPGSPFLPNGSLFCAVTAVNLTDGGAFNEVDFGGNTVYMGRTSIQTAMRARANTLGNQIAACQMKGVIRPISGGTWSFDFGALLNTTMLIQQAAVSISHSPIDLQASNIELDTGAAFNGFGALSHLACFDSIANIVLVSGDAASNGRVVRLNGATFIYGTGNTVAIASVRGGATMTLVPVAQTPIGTTVLPLIVAGISYNFADMPIVDANTLAGINS